MFPIISHYNLQLRWSITCSFFSEYWSSTLAASGEKHKSSCTLGRVRFAALTPEPPPRTTRHIYPSPLDFKNLKNQVLRIKQLLPLCFISSRGIVNTSKFNLSIHVFIVKRCRWSHIVPAIFLRPQRAVVV